MEAVAVFGSTPASPSLLSLLLFKHSCCLVVQTCLTGQLLNMCSCITLLHGGWGIVMRWSSFNTGYMRVITTLCVCVSVRGCCRYRRASPTSVWSLVWMGALPIQLKMTTRSVGTLAG